MDTTNVPAIAGDKGSALSHSVRIFGLGLALAAAAVVGHATGVTPRLESIERENTNLKSDVGELRRANERIERKLDRLLDQ